MRKWYPFFIAQKRFSLCVIIECLLLCAVALAQLTRPVFSQTLYGRDFTATDSSAADSSAIQYEEETLRIQGSSSLCLSSTLPLPSGAFDIQIVYKSTQNPDAPSSSINNSAGTITVQLPSNPAGVRADTIKLTDNSTYAESMIWIRPFAGAADATIDVNYGEGALDIYSIQIVEYPLYRVTQLFSLLLFFLFADFVYLLFSQNEVLKWSQNKKYVICGLLAITIFSSFPFFLDFIKSDGHDLTFHLNRIASLADAIKSGNFPQRIQSEMANGYGYATPLFYGEFFLIIPAILHIFALPLQTCYQIFGILVNFFTCFICFYCFQKITKDWKISLVGSALYTLSSYRIIDVYVRAAVGEYLAIAFFPLLLYGFFHLYTTSSCRAFKLSEYCPIILGLTGIIQSHILSCEMVALFILLFVVIFWKRTIQKHRFIALFKSAIITVFLNLWFLIPFLQSMQMDLNVTNSEKINNLEGTSVYIPQLFGVFHSSKGGSVSGTLHEMPLSIGFSFVIAIAVFFLYCLQRPRTESARRAFQPIKALFFFGIIALILCLNIIPWGNLLHLSPTIAKIVGMVQFSWRYIAIAAVFLSFMSVLLLAEIKKSQSAQYTNIIIFSMIACIAVSEGFFFYNFLNDSAEHTFYTKSSLSCMDLGAGKEYLLDGTDLGKATTNNIIAGESVTIHSFERSNGDFVFSCTNTSASSSYADIPMFAYDNYIAQFSNGEKTVCETGENNRIRISIPAGYEGDVVITYQPPFLWTMCNLLSVLSLFSLLFCLFVQIRLNRTALIPPTGKTVSR